ncbi:MAG: hypothetical protein K2F81_05730 [Ruminococcus sp.]|nr:hypothetical protein [Ruminococcus sp.]
MIDYKLLKSTAMKIEMSDEMKQRLIENIDGYSKVNSENAARKEKPYKLLIPICACIAVALLGFGIFRSGILSEEKITNQDNEFLFTEKNKDISSAAEIEKQTNIIRVNKIDAVAGDRNINLKDEDFVRMTERELEVYYGTKIIPDLPSDLRSWYETGDYEYGIYRHGKGEGEVYYDVNAMNYSNEDFSRDFNVEIAKGKLPQTDVVFWDESVSKSFINGTEVRIGQSSNGYFYAEFIYNNTGFRIISNGMSIDELVSAIESLVN